MEKSNLAKNTILLSLGTFMTKGLSFIMVPFFSRWLSASDYGIYDLLATYATLLMPIIGLASEEALFRFAMDVETIREKSKFVSNCLSIYTINSIIFFIILLILRFVVGWKLALYFFILVEAEVYNLHLRGFLRGIKSLDVYAFSNVISTAFTAVFTTVFIKGFGFGIEGMILGYGFGYVAGNIFILIITKYWRYVSLKEISFSNMIELVKYSYPLIPNSISWWLINVSDRTIINIFLGSALNGIYAIAYKIPNILSAVFRGFSISWQQAATETLNSEDRDKYYNQIYNKMLLIIMSLCCGVLSLNSWMFNYIFDIKYYAGHLYSPILVGSTVFSTLSQFYGTIQISFKQPKDNSVTTIIGAISNLIIHIRLIKFLGLYAAAISTILSQIIVCVLRNIKLKRSVILKLDRKTMLFFIVYIYFTVMAYYITNPIINVFNVILATIIVLLVNRDFTIKIIRKLVKNR